MHEVDRCVSKMQYVIDSKVAKEIGKDGLRKQTSELLGLMFDKICKEVLNSNGESYVVQWALIKLEPNKEIVL